MLSTLAQADVSALKDPGFQQWLGYAILALLLWDRISRALSNRAERREISGRVETSPRKEPADKSEVEDELKGILAKIEELQTSLHDSVREITTAGQKRADAIGRKIDDEVRTIRAEIESRMALVHEKVNSVIVTAAVCESDIEHLKARDYQHDQSLATLQQRTHSPRKAG